MPNWCEGTLKVRGTLENVNRFINNGLIRNGRCLTEQRIHPFMNSEWSRYDDGSVYFEMNVPDDLYLRDSHRAFVDGGQYLFGYNIGNRTGAIDDIMIVPMDFRQAWSISVEDLQAVSKMYHVDLRIQGFERGMQFSQIVEVHDGEIIEDTCLTYNGGWEWYCPCPRMGG